MPASYSAGVSPANTSVSGNDVGTLDSRSVYVSVPVMLRRAYGGSDCIA